MNFRATVQGAVYPQSLLFNYLKEKYLRQQKKKKKKKKKTSLSNITKEI